MSTKFRVVVILCGKEEGVKSEVYTRGFNDVQNYSVS